MGDLNGGVDVQIRSIRHHTPEHRHIDAVKRRLLLDVKNFLSEFLVDSPARFKGLRRQRCKGFNLCCRKKQ